MAEIAKKFDMTVEQIRGKSRAKRHDKARRELYWRLRAMKWSYPQIGRFVGGRDHGTIYAVVNGRTRPGKNGGGR